MGILDGIVEWIAEQVMYGLDLINTSVLGALGCDMTTFLRFFPAAETMYNIFVAGYRHDLAEPDLAAIQELRPYSRRRGRRPGKADDPLCAVYPAGLFRR